MKLLTYKLPLYSNGRVWTEQDRVRPPQGMWHSDEIKNYWLCLMRPGSEDRSKYRLLYYCKQCGFKLGIPHDAKDKEKYMIEQHPEHPPILINP